MKDYIKCIMMAGVWGIFQSIYYLGENDAVVLSNIILDCSISSQGFLPVYLIEATRKMMPLFVFQILFGTKVYRNFCVASVYYFSRCLKRVQWFVKEAMKLLGLSVLYNVLIPIIVIGITSLHHSIEWNREGIILFFYFVFIQSLWLFFTTLMMNLIAIKVGSQNAFLVMSMVQLALITMLFLWEKVLPLEDSDQIARNAFLLKCNLISHLFLNWHSSRYEAVNRMICHFEFLFDLNLSVIAFGVLSGLVFAIGCFIIKRHDLLISNAEIE